MKNSHRHSHRGDPLTVWHRISLVCYTLPLTTLLLVCTPSEDETSPTTPVATPPPPTSTPVFPHSMPPSPTPCRIVTWYPDTDNDGYGANTTPTSGCLAPGKTSPLSGDCDDTNPEVNPAKLEQCGDGLDNNCDGHIDENALPFYVDLDVDGYGVEADLAWFCTRPPQYAVNAGDCDDNDGATSPGAPDVCGDGKDNDCDGQIDEDPTNSFRDKDGDGYGDMNQGVMGCMAPDGYVSNHGDCDDSNAAVRPDLNHDDCDDGLDSNCDGDDCMKTRRVSYRHAFSRFELTGPQFGARILLEADHSGDGYADLVVSDYYVGQAGGDPYGDPGFGRLYLLQGPYPSSGRSEIVDYRINGDYAYMYLGEGLATGAPHDDNSTDILVAAPGGHLVAGGGVAGTIPTGLVYGFHQAQDLANGLDGAGYQFYAPSVDQSLFAQSVAGGGDLNGDGIADVAVGDERYSEYAYYGGAAFVFFGPAEGLRAGGKADAILIGTHGNGNVGSSLDIRGDVNGDGVSDVLVGAPYDSELNCMSGAAYLFYGPVFGKLSIEEADASFVSHHYAERLGYSLSNGGDFNGDGYDDVVLGASEWTSLCADPAQYTGSMGRVYLFLGPFSGVYDVDDADLMWSGHSVEEHAGTGLSFSTDLNRDGYSDLLIGAPGVVGYGGAVGGVYVIYGSSIPSRDAVFPSILLHSDISESRFGWAVSAGGDMDGDGWPDIAVGSPGSNTQLEFGGGAYVFRGGPALFDLPIDE